MNLSFKLLPFVLLTLLDAFNNKRMISIALAIYGFILLLSLGNRGCIVYLTICFLYFFVYSLKAISNLKKFIIVIIVPFIIYLFYFYFLDRIFIHFSNIGAEKESKTGLLQSCVSMSSENNVGINTYCGSHIAKISSLSFLNPAETV